MSVATASAARSDGCCCRRWSASQAAGRSSRSLAWGQPLASRPKMSRRYSKGGAPTRSQLTMRVCRIANRRAPSSEPANKKFRRPMAVRRCWRSTWALDSGTRGSSRKMMRVDHWLTAYVTALPSGLLGVARAVGTRKDRPESGVAVGLDHLAAEVRQDRLWPRALPVRGVLAERDFAAIAQEGPDMAALDAAYVAAVAHRQVGIVEAEQVTTEGVVAERSMKRLDEVRGPRVPVAERRRRDLRATAGQNLALALQRHGVGVLRRHELREHARTRAGTLDRRWRGRRDRHVAFADLAGADLGMLLHRVGFARAVLDRDPHVGPDERLLGAAAAQLFVGRRDLGDH